MSSDDDKKIALGMKAAGIQHRLDENFSKTLAQIVFCENNVGEQFDLKACLAAEKKLDTRAARSVLTLIWSASSFVSDEALMMAGLERPEISCPMTCNSLANFLSRGANSKELNASNRLLRDTSRIIHSAEVYGLVRFLDRATNRKPFLPTELLHKCMLGANLNNALIINEVWGGGKESGKRAGGAF